MRTAEGDRLPDKISFVTKREYWAELEGVYIKDEFYPITLTYTVQKGPKLVKWQAVVIKVEPAN
ncbi:hypothetical protein J0H58_03590 [bacterium]|nr:hypothetical protein [bacterium]